MLAGIRRLAWTYRGFATTAGTDIPNYGFAFDIDGVLIKGKYVLPQTRRALQLLNGDNPEGRRVPFVLLTNGGGVAEEVKAKQLSEKLGVEIHPSQMVLSHSPMRALANQYKRKAVLVIGGKGEACRQVAQKYGFGKIIIPDDIMKWKASIWPFTRSTSTDSEYQLEHDFNFDKERIEALMMFHDSRDWGRDLQIMTDVLLSEKGIIGSRRYNFEKQDIPLFFSNPDIIWSNDFPQPRFGQGTFRHCLEGIYSDMTGKSLQYTLFGKPHKITYEYAQNLLEAWADLLKKDTEGRLGGLGDVKEGAGWLSLLARQRKQEQEEVKSSLPEHENYDVRARLAARKKAGSGRHVYAIGDNPAADIKGANDFGWTSILVKTGVWQSDENHPLHPADYLCDDVEAAVRLVLEKEDAK